MALLASVELTLPHLLHCVVGWAMVVLEEGDGNLLGHGCSGPRRGDLGNEAGQQVHKTVSDFDGSGVPDTVPYLQRTARDTGEDVDDALKGNDGVFVAPRYQG